MAKYTVEKALEDRKKRQQEEKYNALYQAALESPGSVARSHTPMTVEEALEERIKERKRNADSYKSDIVKQYNSLVENYGKYSKYKPFYGVDATKNTRIRQTGISGDISNLITKVEGNRDILGDEDADLILKNLNNMKSGLANEVDASKILTNFTDEKDLDDFMNPPGLTPLIPKGALAPFGGKDSTPVKKDVGGIYQFDSHIDNSGLDKLMFGSSKTKEPLSTDDVKDEDRLAIYAYYTQKAREAEKSGASEEEVNALLKQAEKARSKEGYQEIMNGWLNNDFELDTETAEARQIIYDRKIAEIERLKTQIEATPDGEEKDNLVKRKEALEAETNIYSRNQKVIDDYYGLRNNADFDSASQYRDYNHDVEKDKELYYEVLVDNGIVNWKYDPNTGTNKPVDIYGNVYESVDEYNSKVSSLKSEIEKTYEDKLGFYLNLTDEEKTDFGASYYDDEVTHGNGENNLYGSIVDEGEHNRWDMLKPEEIDTYYYLYNTQGQKAAYDFLDSMQVTLGRRYNEEMQGKINEASILEKIAFNLASTPANIFGGIAATAGSISDLIEGKEINPYSSAYDMVNFASSVRGQTAADIENATGGAAIPLIDFSVGDAYQAVMSGLDSIVGAKMFGKGYTVIMGMNAAANQARDLFDSGASQEQIIKGAGAAGAIEMLTEYVSLDHFLKQTATKSLKGLIKQVLSQAGVEASEEMVSEILNTAYDAYNMKSQSEWAKLKEEGGFQKAFLDTVRNVINAGIGGLISGAGMAAGQGGVNLAMYNSYASDVGKNINSLGNGQALLDNANALSEEGGSDNYIRKLSKKVAEAQAKGKTDTLLNRINTGKLYDTVAETRAKNAENADRNTFKTFVSDAIKDNANIKNKAKAAEILTKSVYDNKLSSAESLYFNKIGGKEIINSVLNDKTLPSSQKLNNILSKMALSQTEALRYESQGKQDAVATSKIKDVTNKIDNGEIKVADAQKTESAKAAEIVNIKSVKDGVMTFEMSDGTEVSSNDITYKSKDEGLLYESVLAMGFNERIGNTVVKNLASSGMSVKAYLNNVALAYDYGVTGQQARIDEVLLPKELRNTLYVVGRDAAKANTERLIAKAREEKAVGKATNKVTYVNDIGDKSKLNNNQKATVAVAEFIAASSPLDVRIYKSFRRGNKTYININGVEQESYSNGWYAEGSNIIYIDINAGNSYEGLGVFTLAHEISHYIRHWNAEEWQQMADFIVEVIDKQAAKDSKYATFEYSLNKKFQKYKSNRKAEDALIEEGKLDPEKATYGGKTDTKLRDMAYEDVICDSLASLFQDKQTFVEFSDNLKKTNPSLWEKFKQAIKKFLDKIDNALKEFAGVRAESEAGQAIQDALKEDRDRIRELFTAAFGGANENFEKASRRGEPLNVDKNSTKSVTHKKVPESKLNSARDTLEERTEKANEASLMPPEGVYLYSGRGNGYDGYSMSNNARAAYAEGEQPLSKWSKKEILDAVSEINPDIDCSRLTLETLKDRFLTQSSWHHTSMFYNATDFYSIDEDYIKNLSQEDVDNLRDRQTQTVKEKRDSSLDESVDDAYAKVQTIVASGLLKTETGAIRRLLDGKDFDGVYRKAVEILSEKDKRRIDQWRKLPEDHWRQAYVKLWDNNAEDYVRTEYANKRLSRNSNVFKTIEQYFKKSVSETGTVLHDERDTSLDPRTLLTNALENVAVTENEKNLLNAYKNQIDILNKQTKRLAEIKAEIKDISFGKGKDRSKLPGLKKSARKFERAISAKDKQLLKLEATKPLQKVLDREKAAVKKKALQKGREDLKTFKEKAAEKLQKEVARRIEQRDTMRQEKYDALQKQRDEYKQREETKRGRRDMTYYRDEIKKIREDFIQQLRNGTDRRFVPKPLVESIISVCNAIDPTGRVYYKPGTNEVDIERTRAEYEFSKGESKAVEKYLTGKQALADLKLAYDNLSSDNDYDFSSEYDAEFSGLISQLADSIGDTPLREMSLEQLSDVYNILSDIRWMLKDAARQIGVGETITNYEAGQQIISEMEEIKDLGLTTSKVSDTFRELTLNPMRAVREMSAFDDNARLVKLFNALNEGRRKADTFRMKTDKKIEAVRDEDRKAYNDAVEKEFDFGLVDINGNEVHITKMQAMFAVLTARREAANANRSHLQTPVLFPDYKLEKKGKFGEAKKNGFEVRLDGKAVAKIMDGLSAWDKRYLAVAEKIYNEDCKNAVNETTMLTKHRAVATEKSYIQYVVNEDYIARDSDNIKFDKSILNEGILKSVKDNADQQLIMLSLNTALDDHIEKVAKIYGLAVPVRNWNKVFNMKQVKGSAEGNKVKSVKSAIFETWGEESQKLLDQAVADLQTSRQSNKAKNKAEKALQKVKSGLTVSVLAGNINVAIKQAASYPTAGSILSSYALIKGLKDYSAKIKDGVHAQDVYDEIDAHTSQHWIRRQGLSTQELGELNQSKGWENRLNNKLGKASPMNWIQAIDVGTTAALWYACKAEVKHNGFAEGSREYWDEVTRLYDKVIEETQPMYDSLHRAEITKSNELIKSMVMFKTQPLQNSGILREGGMEMKVAYKKYGKNSEQAKEARMKFVKAVASQAASHFVFTAMTLVSGMLRHKMNSYRDDDDELTFGSIASEFASQYFRNFFGAIVPIVGDVATSIADAIIKKGNSTALNSFVVDKVNEIINAFSKLDEPSVENYTDMLGEIASFFGIPFSNATNIVKGAILHIEDAVNGEFGSFNAGQSGSSSGNAKKYVKLISDGNTADAKDLYNEWVSEKKETIRANREKDGKTELSDSELEKEAKSSVKSSISSYFREMYVEAYKNGDTETTWEIRKQMLATGLWTDPKKTSASVVNKTCNDWEKEYKKPQ